MYLWIRKGDKKVESRKWLLLEDYGEERCKFEWILFVNIVLVERGREIGERVVCG